MIDGISTGWIHLLGGFAAFTLLTILFRAIGMRRSAVLWRGKEQLEITAIREVSQNVKVFTLKRITGQKFPRCLPGQFLSFQIGESLTEIRSYSMCSAMENRDSVDVAVKSLRNGIGSTWFHSRQVGDRVWTYPPSGHFTDATLDNHQKIFVAGGIGITPILSMIRTHLEKRASGEVILFYGMRSLKDMAFHDELLSLSQAHPNFKYVPVLMETHADWSGANGHITVESIRKYKFGPSTHFFLCGPQAMTDGLINGLLEAGVAESSIHTEKFASPSQIDFSQIPQRHVRISIGGRSYDYNGKQTLLEFAESHDVYIPFACRAGVCGTCKCRVTGKATMLTDAGLTLSEKKAGVILSCVAFPESDLELEPFA